MQLNTLSPDLVKKLERVAHENSLTTEVLLARNEDLSLLIWKVIKVFETNTRYFVNQKIAKFMNNSSWWMDSELVYEKHIFRSPREPNMYSVINLGFLLILFSDRYHNKLWVPCLQDSLPSWTLPRRELHRRFKVLVRVRNRIAHHEIIYNYPLIEIIEFAQELLVDINECAAEEIRKGNYTETINKIRLGSGGGI